MNELVPVTNADAYRASTDAASLCRDIVLKTAMEIQRRKYVKVEGWQAIAVAHGCAAAHRDVERVDGGVRAVGEVRRITDGTLIAQAEGFVGEDEPVWFGGEGEGWENGRKVKKVFPKRADYAIRAMAQTRAISRACRSAFAHVVVLIDAGLSTTPAEEVPLGGFDDREPMNVTPNMPMAASDRPSALKRLSAAQAKERGMGEAIRDEIDACMSDDDLNDWEAEFDRHTAQCPLVWLDAFHNHIILRREQIQAQAKHGAMDDEYKAVVA